LLWPQIARYPDADEEPDAHAQHFVDEQPADVIDDLDQIRSVRDAAMDEGREEIHASVGVHEEARVSTKLVLMRIM